MLYKLIYCYEVDLKRNSDYWKNAKTKDIPDIWDRVIADELVRLDTLGSILKEAVKKLPVIPTKVKIELDTHYFNVSYFFESIEGLRNTDSIKLQLLRCLLIYQHMFDAMEKNVINFQKVSTVSDEK
jgi:hypothetical protein